MLPDPLHMHLMQYDSYISYINTYCIYQFQCIPYNGMHNIPFLVCLQNIPVVWTTCGMYFTPFGMYFILSFLQCRSTHASSQHAFFSTCITNLSFKKRICGFKGNGSDCSCKWHMNSDKFVQIGFVIGNVQ